MVTKNSIVDMIVDAAKHGRLARSKIENDQKPTTLENLQTELLQSGEKEIEVRERLSRLSHADLIRLMHEWAGALDNYYKSKRQSEVALRSRLQNAILAAASHFRGNARNAGEAWDKIREAAFTTKGETVLIEGPQHHRLKQKMWVVSPDGRKLKRPISFNQWRQVYWPKGR